MGGKKGLDTSLLGVPWSRGEGGGEQKANRCRGGVAPGNGGVAMWGRIPKGGVRCGWGGGWWRGGVGVRGCGGGGGGVGGRTEAEGGGAEECGRGGGLGRVDRGGGGEGVEDEGGGGGERGGGPV